MKSKAVVFTEKGQVRYQDVDTPNPGLEDVVIRTKYSWISNGTEGSFLRGERIDGIQAWKPGMTLPYPMVPGYQKVGIVESVGKHVQGLESGQWVFATVSRVENVAFGYGGHIEVGPSPVSEVIQLPFFENVKGLDPSLYSGLVLAQVGYNSGVRGEAKQGECTAVIGDGMVGLWTAQTLQARGFRVALVGRHDFRLSKFHAAVGDLRLNSSGKPEKKLLDELEEWACSSGGVRIIVDTVGNEVNARLNTSLIRLLQREGHFVAAGHHGSNALIDQAILTANEITLHCPGGWNRPRLQKTMEWVTEGKLEMASLITHRFPAAAVKEAWRVIQLEREKTLGVILEW